MTAWTPGDRFDISGLSFRVAQGRKGPDDLRLDILTASGWRALPMAAVFLAVDFLADNEDRLTPYRPGWQSQGGDYFMGQVNRARREGWRTVARMLELQRSQGKR